MIAILGNGISAIICAICLDRLNIEYEIFGSGKYIAPPLLYLKEDKYHLFDEYKKDLIKVGYLYENKIYDNLTDELKAAYLKKQNRKVTSSAVSDSVNEYYAVNLKDVYDNFDKSKIIDKYVTLDEFKEYDLVFNTIIPYENKESNYLYIKKEHLDLGQYTYIYDCNLDSSIKRITENYVEYINPVEGSIKIKNYYDEPQIMQKDNIIYISRNATQTQLKIENIIDYIFERFKDAI